MSPSKAVEPVVMPFGILTPVGPRNHLLDGVQIPTREGTNSRAKRDRPGRDRSCPAVDILKATRGGGGSTGTVRMPIGVY